jgi:ribonuclease P protein component
MKVATPAGHAPREFATPLRGTNETDVPTEQQATQTDTRLSGAHGQRRRASGIEAPARQGAQAADRQHPAEAAILTPAPPSRRLPKSTRIRKRGEFVRLQRAGRGRSGARFVVVTERGRTRVSRIGITTSRRVGDSVVRNRVKRLVREFFRHYQHAIIPAQDVLVIARPAAATATYADVKRELGGALRIDVEE